MPSVETCLSAKLASCKETPTTRIKLEPVHVWFQDIVLLVSALPLAVASKAIAIY